MVERTTDGFDLRKAERGETAPSSTDARSTAEADDDQGVVSHGDKTEGEQEFRSENSHSHGSHVVQPVPEAIQEPEVVATPTTSTAITHGRAIQLSKEQLGTKAGCKLTTAMGCHSCSDKSQHPPEKSPVQLSTASKSELLEASRSEGREIESSCSKGGEAEGSDVHDVCPKENLRAKKIELETVTTGALILTEAQERPLLQEKSEASSPSLTKTSDIDSEDTGDVAMAATTRSMTSSRKPHPQKRPTKLHVGTPPPHEPSSDEEGAEEMFVSSEEERTPEGGRKEFVGHPYKLHLINNGQVVIPPEKFPTHPDTVTGYEYALEPYRRQFSDNNQYSHTLSYRQGGDVNARAYRRVNSEPSGAVRGESYAYVDNNGRKVAIKNHQGRSTL